ncbi:hypothetical protein Tco_0778801 [Tanacetum coccineum]
MVRNMEEVLRAGGGKEAGDTIGEKRDGNFLGNKPSFASVLHKESSKMKVNFCTLVTDSTDVANVLIPMLSVLELSRKLLPFAELYTGDIVSRNALTLCIPSPFTIVVVVMVAVVGSWSGPCLYNFIQ